MVTGRKPYIADTPMAVVLKQMTDPLPRPKDFVPDLPEDVEQILFKALAKQPEDRFEDMNAFIAAMEKVLSEEPKVKVASTKKSKKKALRHYPITPTATFAVMGILAILLFFAFGIPRLGKQFPSAPIPTSAMSKTLEITSSTFTLIPPTSTKSTRTPMPTVTKTPMPTWVTNFAEPILAAIKDREPDFQDDFSTDTRRWFGNYGFSSSLKIDQGVMRLQGDLYISNYYFLHKPNIVLQVDVLHPITCYVLISLTSHSYTDHPFGIQLSPNGEWSVGGESEIAIANGRYKTNGQRTQIMFIIKDSQTAFYINGIPVVYYMDPKFLDDKRNERLLKCSGNDNFCQFDNVKFWNLDNIQNLP
jgi:hypothetical protein